MSLGVGDDISHLRKDLQTNYFLNLMVKKALSRREGLLTSKQNIATI